MKKGHKRILALCILFIIFLVMPSTAHAWKPKTHIYSANLILDEMRINAGYVEIPPYGKFKVLDEYQAAIQSYPEYFRAGAIGPDAFPDIYVGQAYMHPGPYVSSGEWSQYLLDKARALPASSLYPFGGLGPDLFKMTREQSIAFSLGFAVHASGDLFGHAYINTWAGAPFPNVTDGANEAERKNVLRHCAVEAYIDKKIPLQYTDLSHVTIKAPRGFILEKLVTNGGSVNRGDPTKDTRDMNDLYSRYPSKPKLYSTFFDTRNRLKREIPKTSILMWGYKKYMEAWLEDIDEGLPAWVDTSERIAQALVLPADGSIREEDRGLTKAKAELDSFLVNHYLSMMGAPDVAGNILSFIGDVSTFIEGLLPTALKQAIAYFKGAFYNVIFDLAFGVNYTDLRDIDRNPETFLARSDLFPANSQNKLNTDMGNFHYSYNANNQTFEPFHNTIIMAKLNLIGHKGVNELLRKAGAQALYDESKEGAAISFLGSMDAGYDWNNPNFPGFPLWTDSNGRNKVFRRIFKGSNFPIAPVSYPGGIIPPPKP